MSCFVLFPAHTHGVSHTPVSFGVLCAGQDPCKGIFQEAMCGCACSLLTKCCAKAPVLHIALGSVALKRQIATEICSFYRLRLPQP